MEGAGWKAQLQSSLAEGKFRFLKERRPVFKNVCHFMIPMLLKMILPRCCSLFYSRSAVEMRNRSETDRVNVFY